MIGCETNGGWGIFEGEGWKEVMEMRDGGDDGMKYKG
jgi:hypothetical protein